MCLGGEAACAYRESSHSVTLNGGLRGVLDVETAKHFHQNAQSQSLLFLDDIDGLVVARARSAFEAGTKQDREQDSLLGTSWIVQVRFIKSV